MAKRAKESFKVPVLPTKTRLFLPGRPKQYKGLSYFCCTAVQKKTMMHLVPSLVPVACGWAVFLLVMTRARYCTKCPPLPEEMYNMEY